jgi:hypothetical protein
MSDTPPRHLQAATVIARAALLVGLALSAPACTSARRTIAGDGGGADRSSDVASDLPLADRATGDAGDGGLGGAAGNGSGGGTATGGMGMGGNGAGGVVGSGGAGGSGLGGAPGKTLGQACGTGTECASGRCVDAVCCSSASCATCQRCNVNGTGTCSNAPAGTADPACASTTANCMTGACNGAGACAPRAVGTLCGTACANTAGASVAGQWYSPTSTVRNKKCNGTTAGPAGCLVDSTSMTSCTAGLTCADASTCKTSCTTHSDCIFGYYCDAGTCVQEKALGAEPCSSAIECQSRACTGTQGRPTPHCELCLGQYSCPITTPNCQLAVGAVGCQPCQSSFQTCNSDGSENCHTGVCPANAPDCGTDNHCHCGTGAQCPYQGQICIGGQCKMGGLWPCVSATDCAYGTCANGACPPMPANSLCTYVFDGECVAGTTCTAVSGGTPAKCL